MPAAFIDDGYTREDVIPGTKRHPQVTIVYRPVTGAKRRTLMRKIVREEGAGDAGIERASAIAVDTIVKQLVSWDCTITTMVEEKPVETPVEINAGTVAKLESNLFDKIYRAIVDFDDEAIAEKN